MDSTTQWSMSWTMALLPPQEMLPPESLFRTRSYKSTASTNIRQLFGFTPCIPSFCMENSAIVSFEGDMTHVQDVDSMYEVYEDFQKVPVVEEHAHSL